MIELVLVRHAKSDWGDPETPDHERPLNDRGHKDAPRMADHLAATGFEPDAILTSTALRARTTADAFAGRFGVEATQYEELYGAPAAAILGAAEASGLPRVIVVAHDPGMSDLAERLSGGGISHMPTCAVARFTWDEDDWAVATSLPPASWDLDTPR